MLATRFIDLARARVRFGDRVDRLGPYLSRVDRLADAVIRAIDEMPKGAGWALFVRMLERGGESEPGAPQAMDSFFSAVGRVPFWVDSPVVDRGGTVLLRAGPLGGLVLGLKSLVLAYTSPAGNKPLVFSGRLKEDAPRRLHETARFVRATILPGNMRPGAPGWQSTLKVRLIHARIRAMILRTGRWDEGAWGAPINQHDEAGTSLLFSSAVLDGLRQLGVRIAPDEAEAYMHLWRWSGWLMGIDPELLVATEGEAARLGDLIKATQAPPDADSRALTKALLESPLEGAHDESKRRRAERAVRFSGALCRILIGDETADSLGVPALSWPYKSSVEGVMSLARRVVSSVDRVRQTVAFADASALRTGQRYWDRVGDFGLTGAAAQLVLPQGLLASPDKTDAG